MSTAASKLILIKLLCKKSETVTEALQNFRKKKSPRESQGLLTFNRLKKDKTVCSEKLVAPTIDFSEPHVCQNIIELERNKSTIHNDTVCRNVVRRNTGLSDSSTFWM